MSGLTKINEIMDEMDIVSNAHWENVFSLIDFMINGIYPDDFAKYSDTGLVKDYFKNKYHIKIKQ